MTRLDTQRQPTRLHVRKNQRYYARGYDVTPHEVWGDSHGGGIAFAATTAYAGIPGSFGPVGCALPATVAALNSSSIVAVPATAWTTGQYVQTATAGAPGQAYWNGTLWTAGTAP